MSNTETKTYTLSEKQESLLADKCKRYGLTVAEMREAFGVEHDFQIIDRVISDEQSEVMTRIQRFQIRRFMQVEKGAGKSQLQSLLDQRWPLPSKHEVNVLLGVLRQDHADEAPEAQERTAPTTEVEATTSDEVQVDSGGHPF